MSGIFNILTECYVMTQFVTNNRTFHKHLTLCFDKAILDLDVTKGVPDVELEACVRKVLQFSVKTNKATFRNQLYGGVDVYGLAGAWVAEAFNTSQ